MGIYDSPENSFEAAKEKPVDEAAEENSGDFIIDSQGRRHPAPNPNAKPDFDGFFAALDTPEMNAKFARWEREAKWERGKQKVGTAIAAVIIVGLGIFGLLVMSLLSQGSYNLTKAKAKEAEFWNSVD